jgi:predicted transcriptional regulator
VHNEHVSGGVVTRSEDLVDRLEQLDLTNVALARMAGVSASSVQRWVGGTTEPPLMLMRLLDCLLALKRVEELSRLRPEWMAGAALDDGRDGEEAKEAAAC